MNYVHKLMKCVKVVFYFSNEREIMLNNSMGGAEECKQRLPGVVVFNWRYETTGVRIAYCYCMRELKLTGRNLGQVYDSRCGCVCLCHAITFITQTA